MYNNIEAVLKRVAGGIFLMTCFTIFWTGIAEYNLHGRDYGIIGALFLIVVIIFVINYLKFNQVTKTFPINDKPAEPSAKEKRQSKWFNIIFALEGLAIFIVYNVLYNLRQTVYFLPSFALIIGLHFFPLGYLFQRSFDFLMGVWTCAVAVTGILLTYNHTPMYMVAAVVGTGCALSTTSYGIRMIITGRKSISEVVG